jgi:putative toxin-antitoxin system antitoxin component (TIGR02293 family)
MSKPSPAARTRPARKSPVALQRALKTANRAAECMTTVAVSALPTACISSLDHHDAITMGLRAGELFEFMNSFETVPESDLLAVIGMSQRTVQRLKTNRDKALDVSSSDRLYQAERVQEFAGAVLGSKAAAERWLVAPAMGLEGRRPIDLMRTSVGSSLVLDLLGRMQYGVYS